MRSLSTYMSILRKKGLRYSLHEGWKAVWPLWFTRSKQVKDLIGQERAYSYLRRHYARYISHYDCPMEQVPHIIWICWLQGRDNAPQLVQQCIRSIEQHCPDFEVRVLTEETILSTVTLPEAIIRRYREGRIPFAQFSDILRVSLLAEHGGIWMDSTVLMTGPMPSFVTDGSLFMFRGSWLHPGRTVASNWFLASCKGHPVMMNMQRLLIEYWLHESWLRDYYIFHILLYIMVHDDAEQRALFEAMPYRHNVDVHSMAFRLFEPYSDALWQDLTACSTIHKLSYKHSPDRLAHIEGTVYQHVLSL